MDDTRSSQSDTEQSEPTPHPLQSIRDLHEPFDWYADMRTEGPVRYDPHRDVYDVFSYRHVKDALADGERLARPNLSPAESDTPLSYIDEAIVWTDGQRHTRSKGQLFPSFTPARVAEFRTEIRAIAEDQLRLAAADGPRFDFVADFASPVPLRVIMKFVGVPEHDHERVLDWLLKFRDQRHSEFGRFGEGRPSQMSEAVEYFQDQVARRHREPRDDLVSRLVTDTDLDDRTVGANCFNFILAGQGTLTNLLSNAVYLFDEHDLIGDVDQYDLDVVLEEVLRYRSPLQSRARVTTRPITLGGTDIPAGETVILWIGSANRDPERFVDPGSFIPERDPDHLSFGRGAHTCIGAPLARLEAPIALETVFESVDRISVGEAHRPTTTPSELGFERLPVEIQS